jgi:hypothetical protein
MSATAEQINEDIIIIANISKDTNISSGSILKASDHLKGLATSLDDVLSVFSLGDSRERVTLAGKDKSGSNAIGDGSDNLSLPEGSEESGEENS